MTGNSIPFSKISNFTLIFLESTGWYKVNYSYAESLSWGKGKKCEFLDGDCIDRSSKTQKFEEFCSKPREVCAQDRKFKGRCGMERGITINPLWNSLEVSVRSTDPLSDNCPHSSYTINSLCSNQLLSSLVIDEVFTADSLCFEGELNKLSSPFSYPNYAFCLNYKVILF